MNIIFEMTPMEYAALTEEMKGKLHGKHEHEFIRFDRAAFDYTSRNDMWYFRPEKVLQYIASLKLTDDGDWPIYGITLVIRKFLWENSKGKETALEIINEFLAEANHGSWDGWDWEWIEQEDGTSECKEADLANQLIHDLEEWTKSYF